MKISRLEKVYVIALMVVFGGIVLHAPLSVGLGVLFPDYSLLIKSWKEIILLGLMPVAAILVSRRALWRMLWADWLLRLILAYVLLHLLMVAAFYVGAAAALAGLAIDLRYLAFFVLVYIALKLQPAYRRRMIEIGIVGAFIVVIFATLQLFLPPDILVHIGYSKDTIMPYLTVDENADFIRVNSTLRGPNPLGAYTGIALGLLGAALARGKLALRDPKVRLLTIIFAVCSATALWVNYSRSALVAGIITVLIAVGGSFKRVTCRVWIVGSIIIIIVVVAVVLGQRSAFVSNVLLHDNPSSGSSITSNDNHLRSLEYGLDQLVREPLGSGIGSTGSASLFGSSPSLVENQYLFVSHESGWLGLLLFVALFTLIMKRLWLRRQDWLSLGIFASGAGIALIGILLPVWTDDTVSIVWWGFAAIALAGGTYERKQTK